MTAPTIIVDQTGIVAAVTEGGASGSYTLVLSEAPGADVIVTLNNTNGQVGSDVPSLTFTSANWATPQTVTVSAINDAVAEGPQRGVIRHATSSGDLNFDGLAVDSVVVAVADNDVVPVTPVYRPYVLNPFSLGNAGTYADPTLVDIDADGDLDAMIGNQNGDILFFNNTGTSQAPLFAAALTNPFGFANVGLYATPTFVDIDADGDLDAFVGNRAGDTLFFQNDGTAGAPAFGSAASNPFGLANVTDYANPTFADIDGDGDADAFIGSRNGNTHYFENTGTAASPNYAAPQINPFGLQNNVTYASPVLIDLDGDGDLDVFVKNWFFKNSGTATSPVLDAPVLNPYGLDPAAYPNPTFADIDADGDFDALYGTSDGNTQYYQNAPPPGIAGLAGDTVAWAGVGNTVALDVGANATVSDPEMEFSNNWRGASLTVQRSTAMTSDLFSFNQAGYTVSGASLQTGGGLTFASFTNALGILSISFNAAATTTLVRDVMRGILFRNDTPPGDSVIRFTLSDGVTPVIANTVVSSDTIYVTDSTNTTTAAVNLSNGVSMREAVVLALGDITGSQTLVLGSAFATSGTSYSSGQTFTENLTINTDAVVSGNTLSGSSLTISSGVTVTISNASGTTTIVNPLIGAGALAKVGAGTLVVTGASSYVGGTNIAGGTLQTGAANRIADTNAVTVAAGAALTLGGNEVIGALAGAGTVNIGAFVLSVGGNNTSTAFSGVIAGSGGLTKVGTQTTTLSGANAYTGATTITNGTLATGAAAAIPDASAVNLTNSGTFAIGGAETIGSLSGTGAVALGAHLLTVGGDNTSTTFSGVMGGTSGGLLKSGSGVLALGGNVTYSGPTTASAGTLFINGNLPATSEVTVGPGATLGGVGNIGTGGALGAVTVQSGGTIGPGNNNTGTLSLRNGLTLASGATVAMELNGTTPSLVHDQLIVDGSVNLGSATLSASLGYVPLIGDSFTVIVNDASDAVVGAFAGLAEGAMFVVNGKFLRVSYVGGTGNDVVLTTVAAPPSVSGVAAASADGSYKEGAMIALTLTFSEAVTVSGTPRLDLETGAIDRSASYASGSGSTTLTFNYTVQAGDTSADLDYLSGAALVLDGSSIRSAGSVDAVLTLATPGSAGSLGANQAIVIDTTAPVTTIASIAFDNDGGASTTDFITRTAAQTVSGTISAPLVAGERVEVSLDNGGIWTAAVILPGQTAWALPGQTLLASNTLKARVSDTAGNSGAVLDQSYVLDTTAPGNPSIVLADAALTSGETSLVTITFPEAVSGFANDDLSIGSGTLSPVASVDGGLTWTATLTPAPATSSNTNVISLANGGLTDLAGNPGVGTSSSANYTVQTPSLSSSVVVATTALKAGASSLVTIVFSQAVNGFDGADLSVANGTLGALASGDGMTWTATLTPTADVTSTSNQIVLDNAGVTVGGIAGLGLSTSNNYTIDTRLPGASMLLSNTILTAGAGAQLTITFTEAVSGFGSEDLSVANATLGTLATSDGGTTWSATLTPAAGVEAAVNLISLDLGGLADLAGNAGTGAALSPAYAVDTKGPAATVTVAPSLLGAGATALVTVAFGGPVSGFSNASLSVGNATLSPLVSADGGSTWTATLTPLAGVTAPLNAIGLSYDGLSDAAGNPGSGATSSGNYAIDGVAPAVLSVGMPADATYGAGQQLDFVVNWSEPVQVDSAGGSPRLAIVLDSGAIAFADYAGGSGSASTSFRLAVGAGMLDLDGIALGGLALNGAVLRDAAGNLAAPALSGVPSGAGVRIDPRVLVPLTDNDNVPDAVENAVPGLPQAVGAIAVAGDGNGDSVADSRQPGVSSALFLNTPTAQSSPSNAQPLYITLVAGSVDGKIDASLANPVTLNNARQLDAPADLPSGMAMPLGLLSFTSTVRTAGATEKFSLYLDAALGVNGYWKTDADGIWINLASAAHGGAIGLEGGRLRLDFQLTDGGRFDADGKADGVITDPGAPAFMSLSIVGYTPGLVDGAHFW